MLRRAQHKCSRCREFEQQFLEEKAAKEALQIDATDRKMELFESWKSAGKFDKAQEYYQDLLSNDLSDDPDAGIAAMALDLKQSFVNMLITQGGRSEEAVGLAEEVWDKRKGADPVSEISKESHRQLCSIYASLKRPDKAEKLHKLAYEEYKGGQEDAWALENGDAFCKQLAEQQQYDEAALMQAKIWTERQKAANGGARHPDTIKSGKSRIAFLEKLSATLADRAGSEFQKESRWYKRTACERDIDQALQDIWATAESPEQKDDILDVGTKLGDRHLAGKRFPEAEEVYGWVLEQTHFVSRQDTLTVTNIRYNLGKAMYHQGQAKYAKAIGLLQDVYDQWYANSPDSASIPECGHMLAEIYKNQKAVEPIKNLFEGRKRLEIKDMLYLESGYAYGTLLVEQLNHRLAREPMRSLWEYEPVLIADKKVRLRCGRLYGQILLNLEDYGLAQVVLQSVMDAQNGVFDAGTVEVIKVSQLLSEAQLAISAKIPRKVPDKNLRGGAKAKIRVKVR